MNKNLFLGILLIIALGVTLGAVYYLNISSMNQGPVNNTSERIEGIDNVNESSSAVLEPVGNIVVDENTPKDYNNTELMNLEKEINNLDLSNESDIE